MPKVWCASIECANNKNNQCKAKEINLSDGHIHTVHQGYKQMWLCRSFAISESAKEIQKALAKARAEDGK